MRGMAVDFKRFFGIKRTVLTVVYKNWASHIATIAD